MLVELGCLWLWMFVRGIGIGHVPGEQWAGYGKDAQHTALSTSPSQSLTKVHWSTPVDLNKPEGELFIHYGSPVVTAANTVLVPVKVWKNGTDGFKIQAFSRGALLYELQTDYILPPHGWTPPYGPALSVRNRLYYPGPGGTLYYRDRIDSATGPIAEVAFFGNAEYAANKDLFDENVQISTPLVSDRAGNIYFGFHVGGQNPKGLVSGVARVTPAGAGSWVSAQAAAGGDPFIDNVAINSTPALSNDFRTLYFAVTDSGTGYLVAVNSTTLAPIVHTRLYEPTSHYLATLSQNSSASPMVGPDGDVYFGVLETPCCRSHNDRGWLLHFNASLTESKTPGSFGWDGTPSVVPRDLVPSYTGNSRYLLLMKDNNYNGVGTGNGINRVAVLDPNAPMPDPVYPSVFVMKEVSTVLGATADGTRPAVKEWCINIAAVDPFTRSAIVNSEDGGVYRWSFATGTLSEHLVLNAPIGEAYTPTVIGPDGTVYVINDAVLYAIGN
jgi:hypothetical protein